MRIRRLAKILAQVVRHGFMRGTCPVCESTAIFYLKGAWIRGDLRCARCGSRPRNRALMEVLSRQFPLWRDYHIHESSPGAPLLGKFSRECRGYTPSHYFTDLPRGAYRDGFRSEDLEAQSFADGTFDLVITQDVLEHVFDPAAALREIARTLKPDGAHVFTVPWYYWRSTVVRARRTPARGVEHLLEPDYHGNPIEPRARSLVVTEWGRELPEFIERHSGMQTEVFRLDDARRGITGAFIEVFVSRKPGTDQSEAQGRSARASKR